MIMRREMDKSSVRNELFDKAKEVGEFEVFPTPSEAAWETVFSYAALDVHPSRTGGSLSEEEVRSVEEAFDVLQRLAAVLIQRAL